MREDATATIEFGTAPSRPLALPRAEPLWVSAAVVVTAAAYATNIIEYIINFGGSSNTPASQVFFLASYFVFGTLLIRRSETPRVLLRAPLLVAALLMAPLSLLWTVNSGETLERTFALLGSSSFGIYLGLRFSLGRILFLLATALMIAAVLGLLAILLVPSVGIDQSGVWAGTWTGINSHKNGLGSTSALGCLVIGYAIADNRGRTRLVLVGGLLIAALLLVGSRSTTSLLAGVGLGVMAIWVRYLQKLPSQIPVLTFIIVLSGLVVGIELFGKDTLENALGVFGKSSNLSSRVPLWQFLWTNFIEERFWLGYGYEAFWTPGSARLLAIERELYFTPFYSHNGILETWLNGGLILVTLVIALFLTVVVKSAALISRWRDLAISSFPLIYCGYFVLMNFTESTILSRNSLNWALFVAIAVFLTKWLRVIVR